MTMKRLLTLVCLAALTAALFAAPAFAKTVTVKKVDNFLFFTDHSGSMNMQYEALGVKKIEAAKNVMQAMNAKIPALDYQAGLYTFAPFAGYVTPAAYNKSAMSQGIDSLATDYDIFNRRTPMGNGMLDLDPVLQGLSGKTAVIMFTDGRSNIGRDPIAEAKALYAKYGDKVCFHVVSFADEAKGQMIVDEIRAISGCSVPADAAALTNDATMAQFVSDVFYGTKTLAEPKPAPAPAPVVEETVITFRLNFGFDKYQITDEMVPILEQVKEILQQNQGVKVELAGHTDSTGTVEYNQGLSERRADSVRTWLVDNGVSADRLKAVGYGELQPKYDNATREGRALNRRVEIHNM